MTVVKRVCKEMTYVYWKSISLQNFIFKSELCFMFVNKIYYYCILFINALAIFKIDI